MSVWQERAVPGAAVLAVLVPVAVGTGASLGITLPQWFLFGAFVAECVLIAIVILWLVHGGFRDIRKKFFPTKEVAMSDKKQAGDPSDKDRKLKPEPPKVEEKALPSGGGATGLVINVGAGYKNPVARVVGAYICGNCGHNVGMVSEVVEKGTPIRCPSCQAPQPTA